MIPTASRRCTSSISRPNGQLHPVRPGDAILIKPGCRHRAVGKLKVLNIPIPAFDPEDEWFD
jgi:hypothetical protein